LCLPHPYIRLSYSFSSEGRKCDFFVHHNANHIECSPGGWAIRGPVSPCDFRSMELYAPQTKIWEDGTNDRSCFYKEYSILGDKSLPNTKKKGSTDLVFRRPTSSLCHPGLRLGSIRYFNGVVQAPESLIGRRLDMSWTMQSCSDTTKGARGFSSPRRVRGATAPYPRPLPLHPCSPLHAGSVQRIRMRPTRR
jgi:hypothetical protein